MPLKVASTPKSLLQDSTRTVRFTYEQVQTSRPASPRVFTPNSTFTQLSQPDRSHHFHSDSFIANSNSLTMMPCEGPRSIPLHLDIPL